MPPLVDRKEVGEWASKQEVSALPFEALNPTLEPPPDPRPQLAAEYKAVKEWARRPLRVPPLESQQTIAAAAAAGGGNKNPIIKSSVSWSQSPSRDYGGEPEVATMKKDIKKQPPQPLLGSGLLGVVPAGIRGGGSRFDDVLNAPSAPRHDASYPRSIQQPGSAGGGNSASALHLKIQQPMDLDEGRFQLFLPSDGSAPKETKQYSQLLEYVSRDTPLSEGKVPPGWPVYREEDQLWVPLRDLSLALDEFEVTRVKDAVVPTKNKGQAGAVWEFVDQDQDELKKTRKISNKAWIEAANNLAVDEITAAGGSKQLYKVGNSFVIGGEERNIVVPGGVEQDSATAKKERGG